MERSIVKRNVLVMVGLLAAVLLSCGIDSKRSVNGPESYGSLAPRMLFKRASTQATVTIPLSVTTVSITVTINGRDTTVTALRSQGYLQITQVPVGNCLVTVVGKDSSGRTIYSGSIVATILENQIAAPDINVTQAVPILLYYDSPKKGMTVSNSSITLTGTVSYGSGHLQAANGFLINGSAAAFSGPVWSKNVTLTEGTNKFAFYIETSLGNILRDTLTVIYSLTNVDAEGPSLNVLQLVDITPSSSINIQGTVSDPSAPVRVTINGVAATVSGSQFALQVALSVGRNTLIIDAYDALNNKTSQTKYVEYNPAALDNIAPDLLVAAPLDNDTVSSRTIRVSGTATDNSGVTVTVNSQLATIDQLGNWSTDVSVDSAVKQIVITATDKSSLLNTVTVIRTIYFDSTRADHTPPVVSIKSPNNLATTSSDSIDVSVEAFDVISAVDSVSINGVRAQFAPAESRYKLKIKLNSGANTIQAIATDTKGNKDTTQITVTYNPLAVDTKAPDVQWIYPTANDVLGTSTITVQIKPTDLSGISSVKINTVTATLDAATQIYSAAITLTAGANTIVAEVADGCTTPNRKTETITVNYDPTASDNQGPAISVLVPVVNSTVTTPTILVKASVTDNSGVDSVMYSILADTSVWIAATPSGNNEFTATMTMGAAGAKNLTVKACDRATVKNYSIRRVPFIYSIPDTDKPVVAITSPVANVTVGTTTVAIVATITDAGSIAMVKFNSDSTSVTKSGNTYTYNATLIAGANVFTIYARDSAGNIDNSKSVTITYNPPDITAPSVTITSPAANLTVNTNTATIVATITDTSGIARVKFNADSTSATKSGNTYTYNATLVAGANLFTIYARDSAGNIDNSKSVTVTYNVPPPAPVLSAPVTVSATSILVRWTRSAEPDFARYKLFWGLTASVGEGSALGLDTASALISDTARTITGLTPATIYYFKVAVLDGFPSTANSSVVIDTTPLNATTFASVIGDSIVRLRWNSVSGADRYVVYRSTTLSGTYDSVAIATDTVLNNNGLATGTQYFYKVKARKAGFVDAAFSNIDSATTWQMPVITTQPLSQTKTVGQNVVFTVVATGIPTPAYQWKKFGNAIGGATNASYPISAVSLADSGSYSVTITNGTGSIVSLPAALVVIPLTVTDIDGNVYSTVQIGTQVWTVENLRVKKFNDGANILFVTDNTTWQNLSTPGCCYYNNTANSDSINKFGVLYNWYAVDTSYVKKLAPAGWHIPSESEWNTLTNYMIANGYNWDGSTTGNKISKSLAAKTDWATSATVGTTGNDLITNNRSGFSAYPGGYRNWNGAFYTIGTQSSWWNTVMMNATDAYGYFLAEYQATFSMGQFKKTSGVSVRLIKD